jgi:hypothetical protein
MYPALAPAVAVMYTSNAAPIMITMGVFPTDLAGLRSQKRLRLADTFDMYMITLHRPNRRLQLTTASYFFRVEPFSRGTVFAWNQTCDFAKSTPAYWPSKFSQ